MAQVLVPISVIPQDGPGPTVCARHGRRADELRPHRFPSRAPLWVYLLLPLGLLPAVLLALALRRKVTVPYWPVCPSCRARRRYLRGTGSLFLLGAVAAVGAGAASAGPAIEIGAPAGKAIRFARPESLGIGAIVALSLVTAGVLTLSRARRAVIARGVATRDRRYLRFRRPAEAFAEQVHRATTRPSTTSEPAAGTVPGPRPETGSQRTGPVPADSVAMAVGPDPVTGPGLNGAKNRAPVPLEFTMPIRRISAQTVTDTAGPTPRASTATGQDSRSRRSADRIAPPKRRGLRTRTPGTVPSARHRR